MSDIDLSIDPSKATVAQMEATVKAIVTEVNRLEAYLANPGASRDTASRSAAAHADIRECAAKYKELTGHKLLTKHSKDVS